ncbi:hypothetical protein [Oceanicoccus sp. KOV_DT_Chl]|uniref:hypothetical protein n=1 Tax=Oceanicoccus sp. KOV_DT_Chl TaxID=1904639 RepID=UPI001F463214|nr:hypothetical protein [Oceanicoccus sp. KOV_DT_Chl]
MIEESVLLPGVKVGQRCHIKRAIIDRSVDIPDGLRIGYDGKQDADNGFRITEKGIVLVTREMIANLQEKKKQHAAA